MAPPRHINIANHLADLAKSQPDNLAIVFPQSRDKSGQVHYEQLTFAQLASESSVLARGLEETGLNKGDRAILMVKPSLDFFALTFALLKAGVVPVLIDPGIYMGHMMNWEKSFNPMFRKYSLVMNFKIRDEVIPGWFNIEPSDSKNHC